MRMAMSSCRNAWSAPAGYVRCGACSNKFPCLRTEKSTRTATRVFLRRAATAILIQANLAKEAPTGIKRPFTQSHELFYTAALLVYDAMAAPRERHSFDKLLARRRTEWILQIEAASGRNNNESKVHLQEVHDLVATPIDGAILLSPERRRGKHRQAVDGSIFLEPRQFQLRWR